MREALRASRPAGGSSAAGVLPNKTSTIYTKIPMRKKRPPWLLTVSSQWAHGELTVSSAVTESWPGPWLSRDLAVTEPWSYWRCRDWAVTEPWLSCDPAVTELWPCRDWAVTSPSRDWAVIIGPGAVTTVVTVSSPWAHGDNYFLMGIYVEFKIVWNKFRILSRFVSYPVALNLSCILEVRVDQPKQSLWTGPCRVSWGF